MAQYQIKTGDTWNKITANLGLDSASLQKLNPHITDINKIQAGASLNIPDTTPKTDTTKTTATPGLVQTPTDMSASFLALQKELEGLQAKTTTLLGDEPAQEKRALAEAATAKAETKARYDIARQQIGEAQATGELSIARGLDVLQLSPAAINSRITSYNLGVANFEKDIAANIENLQLEEDAALQNLDYQTADKMRQMRVDALNMQSTILQDKINFFVTSWNATQTQKQIDQTQATNSVNAILQAHPGAGYTSLSDLEKDTLSKSAVTLGIPLATYEKILSQPNVATHLVTGDSVNFYDAQGNQIVSYPITPKAKNYIDAVGSEVKKAYSGGYGTASGIKEKIISQLQSRYPANKDEISNMVNQQLPSGWEKSIIQIKAMTGTTIDPTTKADLLQNIYSGASLQDLYSTYPEVSPSTILQLFMNR